MAADRAAPTAPHGCEFEIDIGAPGHPWLARNGRVAITVYPDADVPAGKRLADGRPVLIHKANAIKGACTPRARKVQWAVAALGDVKVYVRDQGGPVDIVVTTKELNP